MRSFAIYKLQMEPLDTENRYCYQNLPEDCLTILLSRGLFYLEDNERIQTSIVFHKLVV